VKLTKRGERFFGCALIASAALAAWLVWEGLVWLFGHTLVLHK